MKKPTARRSLRMNSLKSKVKPGLVVMPPLVSAGLSGSRLPAKEDFLGGAQCGWSLWGALLLGRSQL